MTIYILTLVVLFVVLFEEKHKDYLKRTLKNCEKYEIYDRYEKYILPTLNKIFFLLLYSFAGICVLIIILLMLLYVIIEFDESNNTTCGCPI